MNIIDISQEVFDCTVFPGDPKPEKIDMMKKARGDVCNLTGIKMCAHNGTHVDAPFHFLDDGKTIDQIGLEKFVGPAYVTERSGEITRDVAEEIMGDIAANMVIFGKDNEYARRILIKGDAVMTEEGARFFAEEGPSYFKEGGIFLFGNESQTVGPEDAPKNVHDIMLGAGIVLLEGIRLENAMEGFYILNAAPLNLGGSDGAPCRAILMQEDDNNI